VLVTGPGWRWIFYVNLLVGAAIVAASWRYLRAAPAQRHRRFDITAAVTSTGGVSLLTYAVVQTSTYPRNSAQTMALLAAAAALLGYFVVHELVIASDPPLPFSLVRNRAVTGANAVLALSGAALVAVFYRSSPHRQPPSSRCVVRPVLPPHPRLRRCTAPPRRRQLAPAASQVSHGCAAGPLPIPSQELRDLRAGRFSVVGRQGDVRGGGAGLYEGADGGGPIGGGVVDVGEAAADLAPVQRGAVPGGIARLDADAAVEQQPDDFRAAGAGGGVQRGRAVLASRLQRETGIEHEPHRPCLVAGGVDQRGVAVAAERTPAGRSSSGT
jgi:hypothetical protein